MEDWRCTFTSSMNLTEVSDQIRIGHFTSGGPSSGIHWIIGFGPKSLSGTFAEEAPLKSHKDSEGDGMSGFHPHSDIRHN
jgi:hypothetical protein